MDIQTSILQRRSIRRFQDRPVDAGIIRHLADLGRLYASGANLQPIRFALVSAQPLREQVADCFRWAGYLPGFKIEPSQRPRAYILLLGDPSVRKDFDFDSGAAATNIMLAAQEYGLASCCLGVAKKEQLAEVLGLDGLIPLYGVALGYPAQSSKAAPYADSPKYWLDDEENLHVPKHDLESITVLSELE